MFSRNSPLKRKHNEFHDPDYPQQKQQIEEDDGQPGCSKDFIFKSRKSPDGHQEVKKAQHGDYLHKVKQVIEKEFQREIAMKQQQLEEIDERLEKAKRLLERLRYGIVLAYYKKQEIPLTAADAASIRGSNSLFERDEKAPQMPIHPSVKKLIGKKPKDLTEFMRACPKRTAAQNAVQTIRAKSQIQKREERKLKKIIRDHGIVIDHSQQNTTVDDVNALLNAAAQNRLQNADASSTTTVKHEKPDEQFSNKLSGKSLNTPRLNNKIKHLIVVGNTSKYIGNELDKEMASQTKNLTFKWLVYVQSKEAKNPIEKFIKKVRFHLHQSYRPNDVIDIESPPFQISRRGWGEFPMRVQLFFHSELHQKPVQLIHNIVLDQTLSGIQTLGSETLLEIWLRDIKSTITLNREVKDAKIEEVKIVEKAESPTKPKTNILPSNEELVDENLLDFLNKIEASPCSISADIEKIQPTVVVNEPLGVKFKSPSPEKYKLFLPTQQKSPIKMPPTVEALKTPEKPLVTTPNVTTSSIASTTQSTTTSMAAGDQLKTTLISTGSLTSKPITTFVRLPANSTQIKFVNNLTTTATTPTVNNTPQIPPLTPIGHFPAQAVTSSQVLPTTIQKPSVILNKDGKILMPAASVASAVRRTILPIVSSVPTTASTTVSQISIVKKPQIISVPSSAALKNINATKPILQKKLVQLVDSTGKVRYIQMLVATSSATSSVPNMSTLSVAPKLITTTSSLVQNSAATNTTQITNTVVTPTLRALNGAYLVPAMTTKPNIFKIVPESIQTKPQILTFSTSGTTINTNTLTTTNIQQKMQYSIATNSQAVGKITAVSGTAVARPNNLALQNLNTNATTTAAKKVVFQKEGKLYIIDPQQMKYRQQQKKQVSLLKPEISLLKQQQQKLITTTINAAQPTKRNNNVPQLYFGMKQQRFNTINTLQLMQMKRMLFEKHFLRQQFTNIRSAVEFLLRRLKLVASKDSLVSDYPFVSYTIQEFQSLTAFKQRSHEWLRAKNISRLLRNHKDVQRLNNTSKELFWSTKEIAIFARQYAYTPPIKCLPRPLEQQQVEENSNNGFVDLVKNELKQEHGVQYETLTDHHKVRKWVDKVWHTLEEYEHQEDQQQIIDIDGIEEVDCKNKINIETISSTPNISSNNLDIYLAPPPHLENQCQLVTDICRDLSIKLSHEKLDTNVHHPSTLTVLAQCLHLFVEKVLRQAIAFKQEKPSLLPPLNESIITLMPHDFVKVLASNSEMDFLTNNNFGTASLANSTESPRKQERQP